MKRGSGQILHDSASPAEAACVAAVSLPMCRECMLFMQQVATPDSSGTARESVALVCCSHGCAGHPTLFGMFQPCLAIANSKPAAL